MNRNKIESGPKTPEGAKMEAFFKEAEKVPLANILVSIFKEKTSSENRKLKKDGDGIFGVVKGETKHVMVLTKTTWPIKEEEVTLEVYHSDRETSADVKFYAGVVDYIAGHGQVSPFYDISYIFTTHGHETLLSKDSRFLIEIMNEVASKAAQIPEEERKLYGKGRIPSRSGMRDGVGSGGG